MIRVRMKQYVDRSLIAHVKGLDLRMTGVENFLSVFLALDILNVE